MSDKNDQSEEFRRYRKVVALQEHMLKILQDASLEPELVQTFKVVLRFLRTRPDAQVAEILKGRSKNGRSSARLELDDLPNEAIERMTLDQVGERVQSKDTSRKLLERIASIRFGVTKGAISTLHSKEALVEKVLTLVRNEATHTSIERAVDETVKRRP